MITLIYHFTVAITVLKINYIVFGDEPVNNSQLISRHIINQVE